MAKADDNPTSWKFKILGVPEKNRFYTMVPFQTTTDIVIRLMTTINVVIYQYQLKILGEQIIGLNVSMHYSLW